MDQFAAMACLCESGEMNGFSEAARGSCRWQYPSITRQVNALEDMSIPVLLNRSTPRIVLHRRRKYYKQVRILQEVGMSK